MNELALFNKIFNDQDYGFPFHGLNAACTVPSVDVKETKDSYILDMDLPGKTENDVDLSLKDDVLTIASHEEETKEKKSEEKEEQKTEWLIRERRSTSFTRRFTLPKDVDGENVNASFKNGVLTVVMPRRPEATEKRIAIKNA